MMTDLTEENRLLAVRRDFIANVSHELKTPVGAMSPAVRGLGGGPRRPGAVEHFAHRMQSEATRLAQLINDVIDLSRVQGDDPLAHAQPVSVDALVRSSTEFVRNAAEAKGIQIVVGGEIGETVSGDAAQLRQPSATSSPTPSPTANPVRAWRSPYAPARNWSRSDVKDQGMGIPDSETDRIRAFLSRRRGTLTGHRRDGTGPVHRAQRVPQPRGRLPGLVGGERRIHVHPATTPRTAQPTPGEEEEDTHRDASSGGRGRGVIPGRPGLHAPQGGLRRDRRR